MTIKLSLVIGAIDEATAPIRRINRAIESMTAPVRAISSAAGRLGADLGLATVAARAGNVAAAFGGVGQAAQSAALRIGAIAGLGGGGLFGLVKHTANVSEEILLASQRLGVGVEQYQRLSFAAEQSGVRQEQFGEALKFLSANAVEAATGSQEAAQWFRAAGVAVKDGNGHLKGADQLFLELSEAFQKSGKDAEKVKVAMALMGRSGADLIPFLNQGRRAIQATGDEAARFGLVRSQQAIEGAEAFGDRLNLLARVVGSIALVIGDKLIPKLDPLAEKLTELVASSVPLIELRIDDWLMQIDAAIPSVISAVSGFASVLGTVASAVAWVGETFGWSLAAGTALGLYLAGPLVVALGNIVWASTLLASSIGGVLLKLAAWAAMPIVAVIGNLVTALRAGYGAMAAFNLVLAANPIGVAVIAVSALAGAAYLVYRNWEPISAFFSDLWAGIVATVENAIAMVREAVGGIGGWISEQIAAITNLMPSWVKSRLGIDVATAGPTAAAPTLGPAVPLAGAAGAAPMQGELVVRFDNAPPGTSIEQLRSNTPGFDIGVDLGPTMVMP